MDQDTEFIPEKERIKPDEFESDESSDEGNAFEEKIREGGNDLNKIDEDLIRQELIRRKYHPIYVNSLDKRKLIVLLQESITAVKENHYYYRRSDRHEVADTKIFANQEEASQKENQEENQQPESQENEMRMGRFHNDDYISMYIRDERPQLEINDRYFLENIPYDVLCSLPANIKDQIKNNLYRYNQTYNNIIRTLIIPNIPNGEQTHTQESQIVDEQNSDSDSSSSSSDSSSDSSSSSSDSSSSSSQTSD